MTEITDPSREMRRRALKIRLTAGAMSLVLLALVMAAATLPVWMLGEPLGEYAISALPFALLVFIALVFSPLGTLVSAVTFWTGFWINSCPNCPAVSIDPVETTYRRCDNCGGEGVTVEPLAGGGWVTHHSPDEPVRHTCSRSCASEL